MSDRAEFLRFGMAGTVGFFVDAGVLQALVTLARIDPYPARVLSYLIAATATFFLNRRYTFKRSEKKNPARQWLLYVAVNAIGALINYGVYGACLYFSPWFYSHLYFAVAAGSIAALTFNYAANKYWVFQRPREL